MRNIILPPFFGVIASLFFLSAHANEEFRPDGCGFDETLSHMQGLQLTPTQPSAIKNLIQTNSAGAAAAGPVRIIPTVFHIVHGGGAENITDAQIQEAVKQLNEDYNGLDVNRNDVVSAFAGIYADVGLQFVLARKDPNGNPTDGITRNLDASRSTVNNDGNESNIKPTYGWPRNKYLNIFVVRSAGGESGSAWAYLPGVGASLDGVISSHWAVGRTGTATPTHYKIMTHEVGHWANLHHTFNGGCVSPGSNSNGDMVADTPPTTTGSGCNLTSAPCGELANTQNYMDYGNCTIMFTSGQENRMRAAIDGSASQRNSLWQASNLAATGVSGQPVSALFNTSKNVTAVGGSLNFNDISEAEVGTVTNWQWTFQNGTPGSHTGPNPPAITYNTAGIFDVTLTVNNSNGDSNTVTKNDYVIVNNNMYMHTGTETLCSGSLKDSGLDGKYGNREDHALTLLPSGSNQSVRVSFNSFTLENSSNCANDYLKVYNGNNANAPLVGTYCGSNSPGTVTANNNDNALHLVFHSNVETRADGWTSNLSCVSNGGSSSGGSSSGGSSSGGSSSGGSSSGGSSSGGLSNGQTVTGLAATTGNDVSQYYIDVPTGATDLAIAISGGTGDADLYVKKGSVPTDSSYDCRPYASGNAETCGAGGTALPTSAGRFHIRIKAYSSFTGLSLTASYTGGGSSSGGSSSGGSSSGGSSSGGSSSGGSSSGGSSSGGSSSGGSSSGGSSSGGLSNGQTVTGLAATTGNDVSQYYIDVPTGATDLAIAISGGTGDADLYVKKGSVPTDSSYDCRPYASGNAETCGAGGTALPTSAGRFHIRIKAYSSFTGLSLTASYTGGGSSSGGSSSGGSSSGGSSSGGSSSGGSSSGGSSSGGSSSGGGLQNGSAITVAGAQNEESFYTMTVPAGATNLKFETSGGTGDVDLYVRFGSQPTTSAYDCRPWKNGNAEVCDINPAQTGTYHIMLNGYNAYSGVSLEGSYTP